MVVLRNTRRFKKAVELVCAKLQINDKELDVYITKGTVKPLAKPAPKK